MEHQVNDFMGCDYNNSPCPRARYIASTSAVDHGAAASGVITRSPPATARVGAVSVRPAFWALRRWRQRGGDEPHGLPLALPATPAMPLPLCLAPVPEPAQDRERLARLRVQGERGRVETQDDVGVLTHGERDTPAIAIAPGPHHHLSRLPVIPSQMFAPATAGALDLPQTACRAVVGQRPPPVIARPARLAQAARIHEEDPPRRADTQRGSGRRRGDQL